MLLLNELPSAIWISCVAITVILLTREKLCQYIRKQQEAEAERLKGTLAENRERGLEKAEELAYFLFPVLKQTERGDVNQVLFKRLVVEAIAYLEFPELMGPRGTWWGAADKLAELIPLLDETGALFGVPKASRWVYETWEAFAEAREQERLNHQRQKNFDDAMSYLAQQERNRRGF